MGIEFHHAPHQSLRGDGFERRLERLGWHLPQLSKAGIPIEERAVEIEESGSGLGMHPAYHYAPRVSRVTLKGAETPEGGFVGTALTARVRGRELSIETP